MSVRSEAATPLLRCPISRRDASRDESRFAINCDRTIGFFFLSPAEDD